jgi:hypothetical protein
MAGYDHDKVVKMLKGNSELKQSEVAQKLGVSIGQVPMLAFCKAQVEAGVYSTAPKTSASVKKLRDNEGNRWELIAARTGLGVTAVKTAYEEAGGDISTSYTGRGRNFNSASSGSKSKSKTSSKSKSSSKASSKTKSASKKTSSGRPSARKTGGRPSASRKTATRRSTAGNPS